jgi:hypothetical protein
LREILLAFSSLLMNSLICIFLVSILLHLLLHHHWLLMSLMSCCGPLMEMTFMCDALRFMNLLLTFFIDKPFINSIQLHSKIDKPFPFYCIVSRSRWWFVWHFFDLYITLHLEDFDFFPMLIYLHLLFILIVRFFLLYLFFVPIFVTSLAFHCSINVVYTFDPLIQVMPFGFEVVQRIDCESFVREPIMKSQFF